VDCWRGRLTDRQGCRGESGGAWTPWTGRRQSVCCAFPRRRSIHPRRCRRRRRRRLRRSAGALQSPFRSSSVTSDRNKCAWHVTVNCQHSTSRPHVCTGDRPIITNPQGDIKECCEESVRLSVPYTRLKNRRILGL